MFSCLGPGTQCHEHPFPSGQEAPGKTTAVAVDPGLPRFKFCSEPHLGPQSLHMRDKMATTSILFPPSPLNPTLSSSRFGDQNLCSSGTPAQSLAVIHVSSSPFTCHLSQIPTQFFYFPS